MRPDIAVGDILVGMGTFLLAFFTWRLARQAEGEISMSERSIRLTRESIESQEVPFVVLAPTVSEDEEPARKLIVRGEKLRCTLWNIGKGPALVTSFKLATRDGVVLTEEVTEEIPLLIGDKLGMSRDVAQAELFQEYQKGGHLLLTVHYRDASGILYQTISDVEATSDGRLHCRNFQKLRSEAY